MDKIDYLLMSELLKDAQLPFATIAKKLGVSPQTIITRYQRLKEEGVIRKCVLSIDPSKLGYQGKVFLMITNSPNYCKSVTTSALKNIQNIVVITEIIGAFDFLAIAFIKDLNSITKIVHAVRRLESVERVEIALINELDMPVTPNFSKLYSTKSFELANNEKFPIQR